MNSDVQIGYSKMMMPQWLNKFDFILESHKNKILDYISTKSYAFVYNYTSEKEFSKALKLQIKYKEEIKIQELYVIYNESEIKEGYNINFSLDTKDSKEPIMDYTKKAVVIVKENVYKISSKNGINSDHTYYVYVYTP